MIRSRAQSAPWWAGGAPEVCPFCLGGYAYELEVLCPECPAGGGEA